MNIEFYSKLLSRVLGYINEFGILNVRRFARLLQILKPKDFDLYNQSISHKISTLNLNEDAGSTNGGEVKASFSDFLEMKDEYYMEDLGNENVLDLAKMSESYIKTIQWVLFYYFRGTFSWNYYYPYECVPFVSDFTPVHNITISLDIDKPVKPFTHLLVILPKGSAHLLPTNYKSLLVDHVMDTVSHLL